jgi:hypothetical protein
MLPAERGDVTDQCGRYRHAAAPERVERRLQAACVPQDDGSDQQVQPRCPIGLGLERAGGLGVCCCILRAGIQISIGWRLAHLLDQALAD